MHLIATPLWWRLSLIRVKFGLFYSLFFSAKFQYKSKMVYYTIVPLGRKTAEIPQIWPNPFCQTIKFAMRVTWAYNHVIFHLDWWYRPTIARMGWKILNLTKCRILGALATTLLHSHGKFGNWLSESGPIAYFSCQNCTLIGSSFPP